MALSRWWIITFHQAEWWSFLEDSVIQLFFLAFYVTWIFSAQIHHPWLLTRNWIPCLLRWIWSRQRCLWIPEASRAPWGIKGYHWKIVPAELNLTFCTGSIVSIRKVISNLDGQNHDQNLPNLTVNNLQIQKHKFFPAQRTWITCCGEASSKCTLTQVVRWIRKAQNCRELLHLWWNSQFSKVSCFHKYVLLVSKKNTHSRQSFPQPTSSADPECFNNDSMTWQVQLLQAPVWWLDLL